MTFFDRSRTALATGLLALWMACTDAMLKYLRPSMRPWLLAAAIGLIVIGAYGMASARRLAGADTESEHDEHHVHKGPARIGWLLVVPVVVVILFGPQAMGDFAIARNPHLPPYAFDIAAYASSSGHRVPTLEVSDVIMGATQPGNGAYLSTHDVELRGFVSVIGVAGPQSFVLTHFLMSCCAADAEPMNVVIVGATSVPPKNQWIDVTARLEPTATTKGGSPYTKRRRAG